MLFAPQEAPAVGAVDQFLAVECCFEMAGRGLHEARAALITVQFGNGPTAVARAEVIVGAEELRGDGLPRGGLLCLLTGQPGPEPGLLCAKVNLPGCPVSRQLGDLSLGFAEFGVRSVQRHHDFQQAVLDRGLLFLVLRQVLLAVLQLARGFDFAAIQPLLDALDLLLGLGLLAPRR